MKSKLKNREWYAYTVIKNIFAYYSGHSKSFDGDVYLAHLQLLRLLCDMHSITYDEYKLYREHLHYASSAMDRRYITTLYQ